MTEQLDMPVRQAGK